jgi:protein CpxP
MGAVVEEDTGAEDAETADAETADEEMEDAVAGSPAIADHLGHCNYGKSRSEIHMNVFVTPHVSSGLTAAAILGAVLFSFPIGAMPQTPAAAAPPAQATSAKKAMPASNRVEARIKSLHHSLRITTAQEPQWQSVAEVMRDNAQTTGALIEEREAKTKTMTAIDDLHSYEAIAEAHVAGVKKLTPVMEALYSTMSEAQKKNADAVFRHRPPPASAKKSG